MQKTIRFSGHARQQMARRGMSEREVIEAIRASPWEPAEGGRMECRRNMSYGKEWNGKYYATKQVRPIFVDEASEIVVITVYSYFF